MKPGGARESSDRSDRVSDRAQGIPIEVGNRVWSYMYTTSSKASPLSGYGVGLPLSRLHARYMGGTLELISLPGYGTSAYLSLPRMRRDGLRTLRAYRFLAAGSDPPWQLHPRLHEALKEDERDNFSFIAIKNPLPNLEVLKDPLEPWKSWRRNPNSGMPLVADLQVLPSPPGNKTHKWKHVDAAIKVIAASKLKYSVNALGTVVEGPAAKVWKVCRSAFEACLASGAKSELMYIKVYQGSTSVAELEKSGRKAAAKVSKGAKGAKGAKVAKAKKVKSGKSTNGSKRGKASSR
eukprot:s2378_g3.t1